MVEVKLKELKYIQDIPVEMLADALEAGELRKGKTVGLMVKPVGVVYEDDVLIELKIQEDGQAELLKTGAIIPIESSGSICFLSKDWQVYLERLKSTEVPPKKAPTDKTSGWQPTALSD